MVPDYTVVVAVDFQHLEQYHRSVATWLENKPSLRYRPFVVFYDSEWVMWPDPVLRKPFLEHPNAIIEFRPWPTISGVIYLDDPSIGRFGSAQRYKMLSAFVHGAAREVRTPYWLKLDLDVVATGVDDWINPAWFDSDPAIIAHPWGYTKPANQMDLLDAWVEKNAATMNRALSFPGPLNLHPKTPESSSLPHKRIISWCGFFNTEFTKMCSRAAEDTCGLGKLPVPSQDGFMWYCAKRAGYGIVRADMKSRGWKHCSSTRDVKNTIEEMNKNEK